MTPVPYSFSHINGLVQKTPTIPLLKDQKLGVMDVQNVIACMRPWETPWFTKFSVFVPNIKNAKGTFPQKPR